MSQFDPEQTNVPAPLVAVVGWIIPGAGYWLIGQRTRGTIIGATVLSLFLLGILVAGARVIEVPGFDRKDGSAIRVKDARTQRPAPDAPLWIAHGGLMAEIISKPWFVPQALVGPIGLAGGALSVLMGQSGITAPRARIAEIGTLYTAVAGMLNLLAVIDCAHRAGNPETTRDIEPSGSAA